MYFKTETDIGDLFSNFDCQRAFPWEGFQVKKNMGVRG